MESFLSAPFTKLVNVFFWLIDKRTNGQTRLSRGIIQSRIYSVEINLYKRWPEREAL